LDVFPLKAHHEMNDVKIGGRNRPTTWARHRHDEINTAMNGNKIHILCGFAVLAVRFCHSAGDTSDFFTYRAFSDVNSKVRQPNLHEACVRRLSRLCACVATAARL
jgi:hypothetical protein